MSGADFEEMEHWDLGLVRVPDKITCSRHINDPAVKRFILEQAVRGTCDLCGRYNTKVVPLEQLMRFLLEVVGHFYTDPANFMQYETREGGYRGTVYDGWEVIGENFQLEMDDLIFEDIRASINLERPWADEAEYYGDQADFLRYHWDYFKKVVKHRSRYLFGQTSDLRSEDYHVKPYDILTGIGRDTFKYGLVRTLPAGSSILRCRQHTPELRVTTATQISSPPEQFAISPNRMSPAGISMFYGAFDAATCVLETIDRGIPSKPIIRWRPFRTGIHCRWSTCRSSRRCRVFSTGINGRTITRSFLS